MIVSQVLTSGNLDETIAFYQHVFDDVEVLEAHDFGSSSDNQFRHVKMLQHEFYLMNGGEVTSKIPALFYMIVFPEDRREALEAMHGKLREGGRDLSHVKDMGFSEDLFMLQDKFGLVWHFWSDAHCETPVILPSMVMSDDLVGKLEDLKSFYENVFEHVEFGAPSYLENGILDHVSIKLLNHELQVCETREKGLFSLNTISSLNIGCKTQDEIDRYAEALGDQLYPGGWLKDKMGVVWCVDWPEMLTLLTVANKRQEEAMFDAIMTENPICIEDVKSAFHTYKE